MDNSCYVQPAISPLKSLPLYSLLRNLRESSCWNCLEREGSMCAYGVLCCSTGMRIS